MPFTFHQTALVDCMLIEPKSMEDDRGIFREMFKSSDFEGVGLPTGFVQNNLSTSRVGVLRGLHFQTNPMAQGKLVSCVGGSIFDVAVDLRVGSPTYGQWIGEELSLTNGKLLWIPVGFAHGFCVLDGPAVVSYSVSEVYSGPHDGGVRWDDPRIGVQWPIDEPVLSAKDLSLPHLADYDPGFRFTE
jgi:dTDP-4-dehydrorhamnose 3,5-epimerase